MHLPSNRMLHRLLVTMFRPRVDIDRVSYHEIYFMWSMISKLKVCDVPFFIAVYFKRIANAPLEIPAIGGRHYVMRLAQSYGLLSHYETCRLTEVPPISFSPSITASREVVYIEDGNVSISSFPF
ncbi:hypothetical protein L2E82_45354 [Cichorium intybus]|uniref:Uncharacterized protein n=1 Tax=Cichorium intybus TaxID=13427 RepID=A0ACB8ZSM6_CICIN|nr:hypothetical protein L2E82_45354 [Cichorium intybus]